MSTMGFRLQEVAASVKGLKETGIPLVASSDSGFHISGKFSDDQGLYYFTSLLSRLFPAKDAPQLVTLFFDLFMYLSLAIFCALLLTISVGWTKRILFFILTLIVVTSLRKLSSDVYLASGFLVCTISPYLFFTQKETSKYSFLIVSFLIGALAAYSGFIRSDASVIGIVIFSMIVLSKLRGSLTQFLDFLKPISFFFVGLIVAKLTIYQMQDRALTFWQVTSDRDGEAFHMSHALWHNVYLGLGSYPNQFGIAYSDSVGAERAQEIDPTAEYMSKKYDAILKAEVFRIIKSHPQFAIETFGRKLLDVTRAGFYSSLKDQTPFAKFLLPFSLTMPFFLIFLLIRRKKVNYLFLLCGLYVAAIPPVLTYPNPVYGLGFVAFWCILGFYFFTETAQPYFGHLSTFWQNLKSRSNSE